MAANFVLEQIVWITAARCYLCETKVGLLVHSRNRNERPDSPAWTSALTGDFGDDNLTPTSTVAGGQGT